MMARKLPEKEEILSQFLYDKENGLLIYKKSGKIAKSSPSGNGYIRVGFSEKPRGTRMILVHRIIFFLETGEEPEQVDHIDMNRENNHISNLRASTRSQNHANLNGNRNGTSKYKGVYWHKSSQKWFVQTKVDQKSIFLGEYKDEKEAAKAYNCAAIKYFGEFARLNKIED